ncbi:Uma2 family endonuclease [Paenibacillus sp. YYML68]|uniref:Uma2 family endonuclease n=1 Tax=Paenibacillus sp. YYML68 TaxID=2909250 RepID=UPI0037CBBB38
MSSLDNKYKPTAPKQAMLREQHMTYDDYAALEHEDIDRYELINGRLELMSPSPTVIHQLVSFEIQRRISQSCSNEAIILHAPIDLILSPSDVRQPDLVIVLRSNLNIVTRRGIEGVPDAVIEILSPTSIKRDKLSKLITYAHYGIPEYWIVNTSDSYLELYQLQGDSYALTNVFEQDDPMVSDKLPCAAFTMREIMNSIPDELQRYK